ncbi:MAG TPA: DNA methyltransferase [Candidatus Nanoarchaeia archaeon]|nr:DNA methyltransferase [Candidatus Nanoarchaeia archaeon]
MRYIFILGRNPELSKAEVFSYIKKSGNKIISYKINSNSILIELAKEIDKNCIKHLGGVISIGEVLCDINENQLDAVDVYGGVENNITYAIWNFSDDLNYDKVVLYLKARLRSEKLKASQKNLNGLMKMQDGKDIRIVQGLVDEEYFVFDDLFGKVIQRSNYEDIEERDMKKPSRREALSISPRLAKIMINLSQVNEGETLLDPFCGVGVILQEALIQNIKVIGIDRDSEAIRGANENLKWGKFRKENYFLINWDSRKQRVPRARVIVSEPDLGRVLKKVPMRGEALSTLRYYEDLVIDVINNLQRSVTGKIVLTAPLIRTMKGRVSCNVERIADETGLRVCEGFPIKDFRESQIVGREIVVYDSG